MLVRTKVLFAVIAAAAMATSATASQITYSLLSTGATTFNLVAQASPDSSGLAQYAVSLVGATNIDNKSPTAAFAAGAGGPIGFTFARSADGTAIVGAGQDVTSSSSVLIYNIGITPGDLSAAPNGPLFGASEGVVYGVPVVLASGSWAVAGVKPTIGPVDGLVFTDTARHFALPTQGFVVNQLSNVPEPATLSLLGLALVGGLGAFGRRRAA